MKRLFNRQSVVFIGLTLFLVLYRLGFLYGIPDLFGAVAACLLVLAFGKGTGGTIRLQKTDRRMTAPVFFAALGIMFVTQALSGQVYKLEELLLNRFGWTMYTGEPEIPPLFVSENTARTFAGLYAILVGPLVEELLYRGYAAQTFRTNSGKLAVILLSGIAFSIGHGRLYLWMHTFFAGAVFAYIAIEYSFKWAVILHIINNLWATIGDLVLMMTLGESVGNLVSLGIAAVFGVIALIVCLKNRKGITDYVKGNRSEKGTYPSAFFNFGFLLFLAFNLWKTVNALAPVS